MPTVIIYWSPGRTDQQKGDVIREITETLVNKGSARVEDVVVIFQEIKPGDSGRGGRVLGVPQSGSVDGRNNNSGI